MQTICVIQMRPLHLTELSHLPTAADIVSGLHSAGIASVCAVSDFFPYGFFPKPVSLNILPQDVSGITTPAVFKRIRKAKYISASLFRMIQHCSAKEAVETLSQQFALDKARVQEHYLYSFTDEAPPKLDGINTRLEKPFVKRLSPENSFWCFADVADSEKIRIEKLIQLNLMGYPFVIEQVKWHSFDGENHLLTANACVLPGSQLYENSKSLYRLYSDGQYHGISAGAVLDPMDKINWDLRFFIPLILQY